MDYIKKYRKYKNKYLNLKKMIGGMIDDTKIHKFKICEFHGSLNMNDTFTVPDNIYLIQPNICGISNKDRLRDLFMKGPDHKSFKKIINTFYFSDKYSIIHPNTEICNINMSGENNDFSILGIFDYNEKLDYFLNIIQNRSDDYIKQKLTVFMKKYKKDYKNDLLKLKQDYNFDVINLYKKELNFDCICLLGFIEYIKSTKKLTGILTQGNIDYVKGVSLYDMYNNVLSNSENLDLFDTIYNKIINDKDIAKNISTHIIKIGNSIFTLNEFYDFKDRKFKTRSTDGFTYFEIFMIIFGYLFLNYFETDKYNTTIKIELEKFKSDIPPDKIGIFFTASCLNVNSESFSDTTLQQLQKCQYKLANVPDDFTLKLNNLSKSTTIYNILLNKIDDIYDKLNIITEYNDYYINNKYIHEPYLLWLTIIIDILFFNYTIQEEIDFIVDVKKRIFIDEVPKFYKLIFIIYDYGNTNIFDLLNILFNDLKNLIIEYYNSDVEINTALFEANINIIMNQNFNDVKNILIYSINYYYINKILNFDVIDTEVIDVQQILFFDESGSSIKPFIKHEYLNEKLMIHCIKDGIPQNFTLNLYNLLFEGKKIFEDLIISGDTEHIDYKTHNIYILPDNYKNIVSNIFQIYFKL